MRISDWSSDVCSSDLAPRTGGANGRPQKSEGQVIAEAQRRAGIMAYGGENGGGVGGAVAAATGLPMGGGAGGQGAQLIGASADGDGQGGSRRTNLENMRQTSQRSEEHTSELQSLMRISYAVLC